MKTSVILEAGYEQAALGFSLSYNTSIERSKVVMPKYAFGVPGEGKFMESMVIWVYVQAPRFFWQEGDTYRIATKQSESTMHTLIKRNLTQSDFEYNILSRYLEYLNRRIVLMRNETNRARKRYLFLRLKNDLPEGFLQWRVWMFSYKTLQNMWYQRKNHRLPQWQVFLECVLGEIEHPEFIVQGKE